jgi:hypothetical protein
MQTKIVVNEVCIIEVYGDRQSLVRDTAVSVQLPLQLRLPSVPCVMSIRTSQRRDHSLTNLFTVCVHKLETQFWFRNLALYIHMRLCVLASSAKACGTGDKGSLKNAFGVFLLGC